MARYQNSQNSIRIVPSHTKLLNKDQKPCISDERPEILADYYEHTQWAIDNHRDKTNHRYGGFLYRDLKTVIKKLENNKSPGPHGIPVEFFKPRDEDALVIVLDIFNDCWKREIMPSEMELAELVTLYKTTFWTILHM